MIDSIIVTVAPQMGLKRAESRHCETDGTVTKITKPAAFGSNIHFRLAFRQLMSGKSRYIGAFAVALLLVFFASLVGRMDSWLGSDGKGMMDAFNPADHDIGVQSSGELTQEKFEKTILQYTDIKQNLLLLISVLLSVIP